MQIVMLIAIQSSSQSHRVNIASANTPSTSRTEHVRSVLVGYPEIQLLVQLIGSV